MRRGTRTIGRGGEEKGEKEELSVERTKTEVGEAGGEKEWEGKMAGDERSDEYGNRRREKKRVVETVR